mmetsp:Transcript_12745/g.24727  ORF Transcript_12745/g.24727 Transcript_12745/m.24727 type:complete len:517 (+) Transcript_12745:727-2277(+)|eukprot:CAMPEP_0171509264 /NCGR_PEP_ID=MMETSP0958-20121227/14666_1 /TAXON_ID=87120 /ORGANISM="Aurantiochytrium limacinum, Strain ATCCMYA-1381" /LENGTH=516 /DNA_ID=CAMNT_0012046469 /DNA_START=206 /DNA_END=1756 /DNA_ORIENTATION=-
MENWDSDAEGERFYEGNFFPADLVLNPSEMELLAADDLSDHVPADADSQGVHTPSPAPYMVNSHSRDLRDDLSDGDNASETSRRAGKSQSGASPPGAPKSGKGPEEDKTRRRALVAAASRATRQKRKREREELKKRNETLEKDRDTYLARIAQLQTEVQALRDCGSINLCKENELLRVEIRKHKAFIRSIVSATRAVPKLTSEEQYRLVRSGSDSAVGQIVGLAYTSAVDNSWHWSQYNALNHMGTRGPAQFGVQVLPRGCDFANKKRFNVRIDMPWRPESMHDLRKRIWKAWTAPDIYKRAYSGAWTHNAEITIAEVPTGFEELQTSDDAELRIFHYTEDYRLDNETDEEKPPRDCTFVLTWKYTKLITASSFPENPKGQELGGQNNGTAKRPTYDYYPMHPPAEAFETVSKDDPEACIILCSTTSVDNAGFKPKQEGVQRISLPFIEGAIIRPGPNYQGCMWSILASWPLTDDGFAGFTNDNDLLNNDYSCGINGDALFSSIIENVNSINADDI